MSQQTIATTDSPETGRGKINANFTEVYNLSDALTYVVRMSQSGTSNPTIFDIFNNTGATASVVRSNQGKYTLTFSASLGENGMVTVNGGKHTFLSDVRKSRPIRLYENATVTNLEFWVEDNSGVAQDEWEYVYCEIKFYT